MLAFNEIQPSVCSFVLVFLIFFYKPFSMPSCLDLFHLLGLCFSGVVVLCLFSSYGVMCRVCVFGIVVLYALCVLCFCCLLVCVCLCFLFLDVVVSDRAGMVAYHFSV